MTLWDEIAAPPCSQLCWIKFVKKPNESPPTPIQLISTEKCDCWWQFMWRGSQLAGAPSSMPTLWNGHRGISVRPGYWHCYLAPALCVFGSSAEQKVCVCSCVRKRQIWVFWVWKLQTIKWEMHVVQRESHHLDAAAVHTRVLQIVAMKFLNSKKKYLSYMLHHTPMILQEKCILLLKIYFYF